MTGAQASLPALARHSLAFPLPDTPCPWGRAGAEAGGSDELRAPCRSVEMQGQVQGLQRQEREEHSDSSGLSDTLLIYASCRSYLEA